VRVVVVGGGIAGCSVAYHLTKLGWRDVLLLERRDISCGTTWHAAGLVGQLRATQNLTRLAKYGGDLYERLEAETGQATGFRRPGSLSLARNAERMHELIADILELSMIESGNVSVDIREVRLSNAVDEVLSALSTKAADREVKLRSKVTEKTLVFADPTRLGQMLTNLVDNAIKFNRRGGEVVVSHEMRAGRDIVSVRDTGEGILPEHLQRIFERFYRADRARTREVGGTGLGLSIVKHLARLHGGEVSVDSTLGTGTTFTIELPSK